MVLMMTGVSVVPVIGGASVVLVEDHVVLVVQIESTATAAVGGLCIEVVVGTILRCCVGIVTEATELSSWWYY